MRKEILERVKKIDCATLVSEFEDKIIIDIDDINLFEDVVYNDIDTFKTFLWEKCKRVENHFYTYFHFEDVVVVLGYYSFDE